MQERLTHTILKGSKFNRINLSNLETRAISDIAPYLFELVTKILESGKTYDFIISEEVSGRLVSLFCKKILDGVRQNQGLSTTSIRFVAGGRHGKSEIFDEIEKIIRKNSHNRILLITEHVQTGNSIIELIKILRKVGTPFDIATLSTARIGEAAIKNELSDIRDVDFIYGQIGRAGTDSLFGFYGRKMSGVEKKGNEPYPVKIINAHVDEETRSIMQREINQARADIDLLAQETLGALGY